MSTTNGLSLSCPWPLEYTTHEDVLTYIPTTANISIPCQLGCGLEPKVSLLFTPDEQKEIEHIKLVLSSFGLVILIIYSLNLVLQHIDHPRRFHKAALAYQIPFLLNICYIAMLVVVMFSPGGHMNNQYPIYCNTDESTVSVGDPANGNTICTLTASIIFLAIKVLCSYILALALVLFLTFWFPKYKNKNYKCLVHGYIALTIAGQLALVLGFSTVKGSESMKLCLPTITSPDATLWLDVVPNTIYQVICTVLLLLCIYKLYRTNTEKVPDAKWNGVVELEMVVPRNQTSSTGVRTSALQSLRSIVPVPRWRKWKNSIRTVRLRNFGCRLLIFTIIQSIFISLLIFNQVYWYKNYDNWMHIAGSVIQCQMRYGGYIKAGTDQDGSMLESAYKCINSQGTGETRPPPWSHWLFYLSFVGSAIGGLILNCSLQNLKRYISLKHWIESQIRPSGTKFAQSSGNIQSSSTDVRTIYLGARTVLSLSQVETNSFNTHSNVAQLPSFVSSDFTLSSAESEDGLSEIVTISSAKCFSHNRQVISSRKIGGDEVKIELTGKLS